MQILMKVYIFATLANVAFSYEQDDARNSNKNDVYEQHESFLEAFKESRFYRDDSLTPRNQISDDCENAIQELDQAVRVVENKYVKELFKTLKRDCQDDAVKCSINGKVVDSYGDYTTACNKASGEIYVGNLTVYKPGDEFSLYNVVECIPESCDDFDVGEMETKCEDFISSILYLMDLDYSVEYSITEEDKNAVKNAQRESFFKTFKEARPYLYHESNEKSFSQACADGYKELYDKIVDEAIEYEDQLDVKVDEECDDDTVDCFIDGANGDYKAICELEGGISYEGNLTVIIYAAPSLDSEQTTFTMYNVLECIPYGCDNNDMDQMEKKYEELFESKLNLEGVYYYISYEITDYVDDRYMNNHNEYKAHSNKNDGIDSDKTITATGASENIKDSDKTQQEDRSSILGRLSAARGHIYDGARDTSFNKNNAERMNEECLDAGDTLENELGLSGVSFDAYMDSVFELVEACSDDSCTISGNESTVYYPYAGACINSQNGILYDAELYTKCTVLGGEDNETGSLYIYNLILCFPDSCNSLDMDEFKGLYGNYLDSTLSEIGYDCYVDFDIFNYADGTDTNEITAREIILSFVYTISDMNGVCWNSLADLEVDPDASKYIKNAFDEIADCPTDTHCDINGVDVEGYGDYSDACYDAGGELYLSDLTINCTFSSDGEWGTVNISDMIECVPYNDCNEADAKDYEKGFEDFLGAMFASMDYDCEVEYNINVNEP